MGNFKQAGEGEDREREMRVMRAVKGTLFLCAAHGT